MECTVLKVPGDRRTRWGVWACQGSLETAQRGAPGPPTAGPQFPGKEQTWAPRRLAGGGHGPRSPENGERWVGLEGGDMGLGPGMTRGQRKAAPGGAASSHALGEESGAAPGGGAGPPLPRALLPSASVSAGLTAHTPPVTGRQTAVVSQLPCTGVPLVLSYVTCIPDTGFHLREPGPGRKPPGNIPRLMSQTAQAPCLSRAAQMACLFVED